MREILFRGKRIDNGEWVEGFYISTNETHYIVYREQFDDDLLLAPQNICIPVDSATICQYTGLTDKNGVKIFEGDIILANFKTPFIVEWVSDGCRFLGTQPNDNSRHFSTSDKYICYLSDTREVIGNIFDNPELLKSEG